MTNRTVQGDGVGASAGPGSADSRDAGSNGEITSGARNSDPLVWVGLFFLLLWTRFEHPWILVGASACLALAAVRHPAGWRRASSVVLLAAGVVVGFHTEMRDRQLAADWAGYWDERRTQVGGRVERQADALVAAGDEAADRVAGLAGSGLDASALRDSLGSVVEEFDLTAAALFDANGALVAWEGHHHGRLTAEVRDGSLRYSYSGTPLFSYLYFSRRSPEGDGTAVVTSLMRSELPAPFAAGLDDFASRTSRATGESVRISRAERAHGPGVLDFGWPDEALLSITVEEPDPSVRRAEQRDLGAGIVVLLAVAAWLLQSIGGSRRRLGYSVAGLAGAAAVFPLETTFWPDAVTSLANAQLAGPPSVALGRVLLFCVAATPFVIHVIPRWRLAVGEWALPVAVAAGFPATLAWMGSGGSAELLGTTDTRWIFFQLTVTTVLALVAGAALALRSSPRREAEAPGLTVLGLAVAAGLSAAVAAGVRTGPHVPPALSLLWMLPAILIVRGMDLSARGSYLRWFCGFWLAVTAALPFTWSMRTEARMGIAEEQLQQLGSVPDPEVDALLDRFANLADSLDLVGAGDVELMYRAWANSGLAEHGSPIFVTLWSAEGAGLQELGLGTTGDRPALASTLLPLEEPPGATVFHALEEPDLQRFVAVTLSDGRIVSGAIPPRRTISAASPLGPLFASMENVGDEEFLTLVAYPGDLEEAGIGAVRWSRNEEGWGGETVAMYPDGPYTVSFTISIANLPVMGARATLLLVLSLVVFSTMWLLSVALVGFRVPVPVDWRALLTSFRARVTWTLFGFFILSNVVFGTLAYRNLTGASERTATALAERVVAQIGQAYREEGGSMESLARRVGAHLLEYRDGELVGGSVDEFIELGLYEFWVDPEIFAALESGRRAGASKVANLGDWQYVLAHRRLPDGDIVASPVPLRAGAAALRRRDVADLLGAAIVLGPILSLGLALFVGRALTRPIQILQSASEGVGRGDLGVHLPDHRVDEFGSVFAAFNRMVKRLGEARTQLLRTTRRTQTIVEEVATGVIAVDPAGRVTVANPRAEALLATPLQNGMPIPGSGGPAADLAAWLEAYGRGGRAEADGDFRWSGRRIRARARRIAQEGQPGGIVVSLADVTDELRSERILAWGEMAKQVAHEVKNPLTPMKLSVQHLLRAWTDQRRDFSGILKRNAGAILGEIDRLALIASSFSRLASPGAAEKGPLVPVAAGQVVREVLDLYSGGGPASVQVEGDLPPGLPPAACRADELKEVLLNLVENARDAMPGGGAVRIVVAQTDDDPGRQVISVEDEGVGIPDELLPRIFEPRFSTRSTGAGLGLAIVNRLVDSWQGTVEVESEAGVGTRVRIHLQTMPEE